jgi:hypothetical protein
MPKVCIHYPHPKVEAVGRDYEGVVKAVKAKVLCTTRGLRLQMTAHVRQIWATGSEAWKMERNR